jgi:thioester reductase-like protein
VGLDQFPLTVNGKVDRQALAKSHHALPEGEDTSTEPRTSMETQLAEIWKDLLGLEQINLHLNFFHLGGNSLLAVQLANQISDTFQIELPLNHLFEAPTIATLSRILEQLQKEGASGVPSAELDLASEAVLDAEIQLKEGEICPVTQPQDILLTGATGYLGTFLLHELLHQTQAKIYCLVRADTIAAGKARLQQAALAFDLRWDEALGDRIIPILGDLSQPLLGLTQAEFEALATRIDCIYHSGAQVNFTYPYQALKATNVLGTQEVLRLATQQNTKPVHFVSTTHVFSVDRNAETPTIWETLPPDLVADLPTGYAQSKWVAEQLVAIARSRGLPASIYRPSLIVGHQQTGAGNAQDLMFRMIKGCFQLGIAPDLDLSFNIVPVDYVSGAIVHLSTKLETLGNTFHMVNPHHIAIQWKQIVQWLQELNYDLPIIPYSQWLPALQLHCEDVADNALHPLLPVFLSIGNSPATALLSHETLFDCQNTLAGLVDTTLTCPMVDVHWLSKYLSFFGDRGIVPLSKPPGHHEN